MSNFYISMEKLERWSAEGKIAIAGDEMTILADGRTYQLVPAVNFVEELGDAGDTHGLLGRLLPHDELGRIGAELYMDSVVVGEAAYRVVEVYITRALNPAPATAAPQVPNPAVVMTATGADESSAQADADLLAKVLLED